MIGIYLFLLKFKARFALPLDKTNVGKCYNRHFDLVKVYNVSLINMIQGGISHPYFYGDFLKTKSKK